MKELNYKELNKVNGGIISPAIVRVAVTAGIAIAVAVSKNK